VITVSIIVPYRKHVLPFGDGSEGPYHGQISQDDLKLALTILIVTLCLACFLIIPFYFVLDSHFGQALMILEGKRYDACEQAKRRINQEILINIKENPETETYDIIERKSLVNGKPMTGMSREKSKVNQDCLLGLHSFDIDTIEAVHEVENAKIKNEFRSRLKTRFLRLMPKIAEEARSSRTQAPAAEMARTYSVRFNQTRTRLDNFSRSIRMPKGYRRSKNSLVVLQDDKLIKNKKQSNDDLTSLVDGETTLIRKHSMRWSRPSGTSFTTSSVRLPNSRRPKAKECEVVAKLEFKNLYPIIIPEKPELIPEKPEMIPEKPELIPEKPELIPVKPELIPEKPELIPEKPELIPEHHELIPQKPELIPEKPELIPEKHELMPEKHELIPEKRKVQFHAEDDLAIVRIDEPANELLRTGSMRLPARGRTIEGRNIQAIWRGKQPSSEEEKETETPKKVNVEAPF
jgi:hypothetical protein